MPDANETQGIDDPADPGPAPGEVTVGVQPGDDQVEAGDGEEPQEPEELLLSLMRSSFKAFEPYPRPCRWLMGPLVLRYRLSSGKAWQKPQLKTRPLYGEPPGPFVTG